MNITSKCKCGNRLEFKCKVCGKSYFVDHKDIMNIPVWMFESCSFECAKEFRESKLLTLNK